MNARLRRIAADYEEIKKNFDSHKNIIVEPIGFEPAEKYKITYYINGIYLNEDNKIETLNKHIITITLHSEYPRYKPICTIKTPIWHPNFRDGQICIGDIWGAGESLCDIIVNIGDMIQYKSWNSFSPLSADAAKWAIGNKHLFPVGNVNLWTGKEISETLTSNFDIDIFNDDGETIEENEDVNFSESSQYYENEIENENSEVEVEKIDENDFDITAEELEKINFVPTVSKMQNSQITVPKGGKINFKTIFFKGILYGLIGGFIAWILQEVMPIDYDTILAFKGYTSESLINDVNLGRISEGIYYGSKKRAIKYGFIGLIIALFISFCGGFLAQSAYSSLLNDTTEYTSQVYLGFVRAIGWTVMGAGVGIAIGLIKPEKIRIINCVLGGIIGGFIGGFLFNFIAQSISIDITDKGTVARAIGIIIMGTLIGLGIGLLEQFAKTAWLKVIRGEFEGKEYLVFKGITSIGNSGKNTIVLFKDKLVAPNHCDIVQEGNRYVLVDKGSPSGTFVNGVRITRHTLKQGDAISVGNSVLVFNTK
ncbi:FHA domain-containing protein [Clostridium cagae]|uniref:FHA domain-containing protein n=1 Tax=Clostridium cagae TaxID=2080751 RepID=UPI003F761BDC